MIKELEKKFNYTFKKPELLKTALIHKSYNEGVNKDLPDNEKLEFLGDSVINLIITEYLFKKFTRMKEGELSKIKAHLVSSNCFFEIAQSINLNDYIYLGKGEEKSGGRKNKKIIASLFEALVGAIYLDSNFRFASASVLPLFKDQFDEFQKKETKINDYKSELQELIQKENNFLPTYKITATTGTSPNITFTAAVYFQDNKIVSGQGKNKRQAEQDAAFNALKKTNCLTNYKKLSEVFFIKND